MGTESQFRKMESSGDGWWGRLHNNVNEPKLDRVLKNG